MDIGKAEGFEPPETSPYLTKLYPSCKEFTQSKVALKLIRDDIKEYRVNEKAKRPVDPLLDEAIRRTAIAFRLPQREAIIHLNDVFGQDLPIWSSSPGIPWSQIGYKTKDDIRKDPEAVQRVRYFWHQVKARKDISLPDCCAYMRFHLCKVGDTKVRAVWGYPATVTFAEAMFALPLIRAYQKRRTPLAYGYETGTGSMRKIFQQFQGSHFLGIDFSNFDKTLPAWLIKLAFDVMAINLDFTKYHDHGVPCTRSIIRVFETLEDYCINTKIRMCNALVKKVEIQDIVVFGDDSLMGTRSILTPDDVQEVLRSLGMVVNVEKSGFSRSVTNLTFLGYGVNGGFPLKHHKRFVASLVWPERNDKCWDDVASRALGIIYANLGVDDRIDL
ncbi:uncharacterized protein LOC116805640 [Drosophila grimshawi]|uniref:uncharacterized protein LOC116805640 n=1 Tax=Drosophila grimshawi TaxID=7222 RepID=UPI000C86E9B5|nr:uncharacterized protein LOC116805640 [Drosophila grimshawi]